MEVDMVDFLAVPVVDHDTEMVGDTELFNHRFDRLVQHGQGFGRGFVEILVVDFREGQQMDPVLGAVVGDNDDIIGFVEYFGRDLPVDNAAEDAGHGGEYTRDRSERNMDLGHIWPLANMEMMY